MNVSSSRSKVGLAGVELVAGIVLAGTVGAQVATSPASPVGRVGTAPLRTWVTAVPTASRRRRSTTVVAAVASSTCVGRQRSCR